MLKELQVSSFALIDDLKMTFDDGLSAMTGETGAGKSIILESLQLLFGKRSDVTMIRHGEDKAVVTGSFLLSDKVALTLGLPRTIDITREVDTRGRHQMRINDELTTLARLKEITGMMGSIHSQHETMALYDKTSYLSFIDQVDQKKADELLNHYLVLRSRFLDEKQAFQGLSRKKSESLEKAEFLAYQVKEIESYELMAGESTDLTDKINKLKHHDKIMTQLREAYQSLDNETFSVDQVYDAKEAMSKITGLDPSYASMKTQLENAYYELDDVKSKLYQTIESLDFDEALFNRMQERSYELAKIEKKYQKSVDEIMQYYDTIKAELLMITDYDTYLKEAKAKVDKAFELAYDAGLKLSALREKLSSKLVKDVLLELKDLDLDKATFTIYFEPKVKDEQSLFETGLDQVEFMISLNEGEPEKPLSKVASGGERARFMFALKSIYAKANELSMLVLDEIDIGISGRTAFKVALKMSELSKDMQLIVITHLPQVAAKADHHLGITKEKENGRMVTHIHKLSPNERIEAIALMLSDDKLSHFAIEQAKMLLKKA